MSFSMAAEKENKLSFLDFEIIQEQGRFLQSFNNFSILLHENKKYLLEIKESLLIAREKISLNRKFNSAPLYLFD